MKAYDNIKTLAQKRLTKKKANVGKLKKGITGILAKRKTVKKG